jgi:hypothetical protein
MATATPLTAPTDQRAPLLRVAALVVPLLLVSLLVLSNSRAAFTAETTTDGEWTTATVGLAHDPGGVEFSADGLVPGDVVTGAVTVEYTGSAESVDVAMYGANLEDPNGLASQLVLTITDPDEEAIYSGTLAQFVAEEESVLPWPDASPGDERTYEIEVAFDDEAGNDYQGATASVDFVWEATSNPTHSQD